MQAVVARRRHAPRRRRARRPRARRARGGTSPRTACGSTWPASTVPCSSIGQRAQRVEAHHAQRDPRVGEALAHHRIAASPFARARSVIGRSSLLERELLAERRRAPLERERPHRDAPARRSTSPTTFVGRGARAVEERLVELAVPGDLHDRPDLDRRAGPSARGGTRGPCASARRGRCARCTKIHCAQCASDVHTFWPVITHSSPSSIGAGLHVGEVGARVGLGVALAPDLGAREDPGQERGAAARRCRSARSSARAALRRRCRRGPVRRRGRTPRRRSSARRATRRGRRTRPASRARSSCRGRAPAPTPSARRSTRARRRVRRARARPRSARRAGR